MSALDPTLSLCLSWGGIIHPPRCATCSLTTSDLVFKDPPNPPTPTLQQISPIIIFIIHKHRSVLFSVKRLQTFRMANACGSNSGFADWNLTTMTVFNCLNIRAPMHLAMLPPSPPTSWNVQNVPVKYLILFTECLFPWRLASALY